MKDVVIILAMLASAYALSTLFSPNERRRFGLVSGAEFFVLGALLGPMGLSLLSQGFAREVAPAIVAACACLSFTQGLRLRRSRMVDRPRRHIVALILQPLLTGAVIFGALSRTSFDRTLVLLWSIAAATASQSALVWVRARNEVHEDRDALLRSVTGMGGVVALIAVAFVPLVTDASKLPFVAASIAGSLLFAALVAVLLGRGYLDPDFTWVALVGFLTLGTGMALQIDFPLVSVGALMGLGIGWFSRHADGIDALVAKTERPAMLVLLLLLGTQLVLSVDLLWLALAFVAVRFVAALLCGAVVMGRFLGAGVLSGGEAATLIVASTLLVRPANETALLLAAHGLSLVLGDLLGAPLVKRVLAA